MTTTLKASASDCNSSSKQRGTPHSLPSVPSTPLSTRDQAINEVWVCASPKAGSGAGRSELDRLLARLSAASIEHCVTHDIASLKARLADSSRPADRLAIVAAGGDGTIALIAQNISNEIPIVPMPMGTENLLARYWGYTCSADAVADTIIRGERFVMDAGLANGKLFLVMVTAGMDAEVVRGMHLTRRGHISRWSYTRPILRSISRYLYPTITSVETLATDEEATASACWMMAFNLPRYAGGLGIEPGAVSDDGLLDRIALKKGFLWSGLNYLARIKFGWHLRHPDVSRQRIRRARWTATTRVPYQIDGDYAGRLPVDIEVLPGRVTLLRPATFSLPASG